MFLLILFSMTSFAQSPRAISLSPAITELVFYLKAEKLLVGTSEFSDYPDAAKNLPRVGPYTKPSIEKILALKPTVVFIPTDGPKETAHSLKGADIKFVELKMRTVEDIGVAAEILGRELGVDVEAHKFKEKWTREFSELYSKSPKVKKSVVVEIQLNPLMIVGSETFMNDIVEKCGGINLFAGTSGYKRVNIEKILAYSPKIFILADHFSNPEEKTATLNHWKKLLPSSIVAINPDLVSRPGPRLIEGAREICGAISD